MASSKKRIGAFVGKFLPPHKGHLDQIEISAEDCDELYVVLADNKYNSKKLCDMANIPYIDAKLRLKWLKEHLGSVQFDEIHIIPYGTPKSTVAPKGSILFDDEERNRKEWKGKAYPPEMIFEILKAIGE